MGAKDESKDVETIRSEDSVNDTPNHTLMIQLGRNLQDEAESGVGKVKETR